MWHLTFYDLFGEAFNSHNHKKKHSGSTTYAHRVRKCDYDEQNKLSIYCSLEFNDGSMKVKTLHGNTYTWATFMRVSLLEHIA